MQQLLAVDINVRVVIHGAEAKDSVWPGESG